MGSPTVFINFMMACRISDIVVEIPGGPNAIAVGCHTVFIGPAGGGGAAGGAGGSGAEGGEKSEGDGLTVQGKAAVDVDTVSMPEGGSRRSGRPALRGKPRVSSWEV